MNASHRSRQMPNVMAVLDELNKCSPRSVSMRKTSLEVGADKAAKWLMIFASVLMVGVAILAVWQSLVGGLSDSVKLAAQLLILLSVSVALLALLLNIISGCVILFRWRHVSFHNLREDILHEQSMAFLLSKHGEDVLADARYWLELKIKRVESRVTYFFGEKTAILAILATAYPISKELSGTTGSIKWIGTTLSTGMTWDNLPNMLLLWLCAFVLGLSLGALLLRKIAARYRYQVEIIDLARR
ncbi:hypothetical protein ACW582_09685 [Pseudomonas chlororaphis]